MKRRAAETVSIFISDVKPLDPRFVQIVSDYLDRIQNHITSKSEPRHIRLLFARRPRISNTEAQAIRTSFPTIPGDHSVLPAWVHDSVILWHRELIKAVIVEGGSTAPEERITTSITASRDRRHGFLH